MTRARYDGATAWYESFAADEVLTCVRNFAVGLLGPGPGRCLDLGCGTGLAIPALVAAGWSVVGVDVSRDQLAAATRLARGTAELVEGDAHAMPFPDAEFDAVISILTHTDLDDVRTSFTEARRVLRADGLFVYLGAHVALRSSPASAPRESMARSQSSFPATRRAAGSAFLPMRAAPRFVRGSASTTCLSQASSTRSSKAVSRSPRYMNPARPTRLSSSPSRQRHSRAQAFHSARKTSSPLGL
jgi:SAM-dependent methyltransferase